MADARYDAVADWYAVDGADQSWPATHSLLALAGPVQGRRVLDLACGHGPIARELARRGATVLGIDISSRMLARARQMEINDQLGITYLDSDVSSVDTVQPESFDIAVCHFGLSDIDDLDGALATTSRLLVSGGAFVFSILHPCFPGFEEVSGSWPSSMRYWDEGYYVATGSRSVLRRRVGSNHRTLATYFGQLCQHKLYPCAIEEPQPADEWARTRRDAARFPLYLTVRCLKK